MALSTAQALDCFNSTDLIGIGMEADAVRRRLHPEDVVTYTAEPPAAAIATPAKVAARSASSGRSIRETLRELQGEGCTLLADAAEHAANRAAANISAAPGQPVVPVSEATLALDLYLEIHRTAHQLGLASTAAMVFGCGESLPQRVAHLEAIGRLQQETGGLLAFTAIAYQPTSRAHLPADWEEATAVEYLKTLSVARIALESIPSIVADCSHQPLKVIQMALRFGADDAGSLAHTSSAPHRQSPPSEEDLRRIIRDCGLRPVQRDLAYRLCYLTD